MRDMLALTVQTVGPAVKAAGEILCRPARIALTRWRINLAPSAMDADIVECANGGRRFADNNDRIVMDVECYEVAITLNVLQPSRLQPGFAPQSVPLGLGIFGRNIGISADGDWHFQISGVANGFGHIIHTTQSASKRRSHSSA